MKQFKKITMLGSGRWGTAMAIYLSRKEGVEVTLQCHLESEYQELKSTGRAPNLPGFDCGGKIKFALDLNQSVAGADLVVISTPVPFLAGMLSRLKLPSQQTVLLSINKGIARESLLTVPEIIQKHFPENPLAHLGGPCFPEGLLSSHTPVAETLACQDQDLGRALVKLFSSPTFRVYQSMDLKGVALLGALKNIYAIIAGIAEGAGMYEEAIAVLVTRGLAEMRRIADCLGISEETIYGLSGLGDLALTCYSPKSSHNKNFGKRIGQGEKVADILNSMKGTVAEGYYTTQAVHELAESMGLELPLAEMAHQVIYKDKPLKEALLELMSRPPKMED